MSKPSYLVQGTLDLLILKILALASGDVLQVSDGSLYPGCTSWKQEGWIRAEWKPSENNRRAKFYSLTRIGERRLKRNLPTGSVCPTPFRTSSDSRRREKCGRIVGCTPYRYDCARSSGDAAWNRSWAMRSNTTWSGVLRKP